MEDELISDLQEIITDISNFGEMNQLQVDQYCEEILTLIRKREIEARICVLLWLQRYVSKEEPLWNIIAGEEEESREELEQQLKEVDNGKA